MATAKEATVRITERIPSKVAYAYLELTAANVNEFASLREEALTNPALAHYAFASEAPTTPDYSKTASEVAKDTVKAAMKAAQKKGADVGVAAAGAEVVPAEVGAPEVDSTPAPTEEGQDDTPLSPREIARQRLLAKKGK